MGLPQQVSLAIAAASANNICLSQTPGAGVAFTLNGTTAGVLDVARRVLFTPAADESTRTFTVTGTNASGAPLVETISGANATAFSTTQDFKTVTGITHSGTLAGALTVGTSGVASTPWQIQNTNADPVNIAIGVTVSGSVNFTVQYTYDDPNAPFSGTFPTAWDISALANKTAATDSALTQPVRAIRLTQNSFTAPGSSKMIIIAAGLASP